MSSHEPYGVPASCLRCFCLKKQKNTVCTRCFHSLRVVLDTKCPTAPALSCTRIPMRHTSLCDCRSLLLHRLPCISFKINLRKSFSIYFSTKKFSSPIETLHVSITATISGYHKLHITFGERYPIFLRYLTQCPFERWLAHHHHLHGFRIVLYYLYFSQVAMS